MSMKRTRIITLFDRFRGTAKAEKETGKRQLVDPKSVIQAVRENPLLVFLAFLLVLGTVLGALFARGADEALIQKLDLLFSSDVQARAVQSSGAVFIASLSSAFLFLAICFFLGLSLWGMFILPVIPLFRGFGFGLASGYLYAAYGFQGILFNAIVVLPGAFLSMLAILFAAKEGIRFSKKALSGILGREHSRMLSLRLYAVQFGTIMILAAAAATIDLVTTICFSGAFSF